MRPARAAGSRLGRSEARLIVNTSTSGGQIVACGFIVQLLLALLDVVRNQASFVRITLDPNEAHEQFDFAWFYDHRCHAV